MRRKDRLDTSAQTTPSQNPDKVTTNTAPSSKTTKKTSTSRRKSQTPIPSSLSRSNSFRKQNSSLSDRAQRTLTQIDWGTPKPQELDLDDGQFDYIEADAGTNANADEDTRRDDKLNNDTRDVIEIEDDSGSDVDYRPAPSSRTRPARGVRFEQDAKKTDVSRRRKSTPLRVSAENNSSRRRSGGSVKDNKNWDKQSKGRDKTLTQMDYVRRYLKIEPDDEVKLEYTYYSPKKDNDPGSREAHLRSANEASRVTQFDPTGSDGSKRRRLTGELDSKEAPKFEKNSPGKKLPQGPVTPKKPIKSEIPSSQSPESPGFAVISPPQFRGISRFSLKPSPNHVNGHPIKEEPFEPSQKKALHDPEYRSLPSDLNSPTSCQPDLPPTTRNNSSAFENEPVENGKDENDFTNTQRTVVYETDAESEYGESQDDLAGVSDSLREQDFAGDDDHSIEDNELQHDDSQELPPPVLPSGPDNDSGSTYPDVNLSSDASICYRRPPQPTQYPLDPIPFLNTQKMTELFPQEKESSAQQIPTDTTQTQSSPNSQRRRPLPIHPPQTQTQTQSQSQSQDLEKTSTEIVPESSPVTRQESGIELNPSMPHESCASESVVQVESSQPADKLNKNARMDQDSGPRRFMLSSSVMESIPMPPLWVGSQDSVGEPYSEPDKE